MFRKNIVICGASGLVGKELLKILLSSEQVSQVYSIGRRKLPLDGDKLQQCESDFSDLDHHQECFDEADVGICCLGTTLKAAGSKELQYKVDHDYVVDFAQKCKNSGVHSFLVISAMGSNEKSMVFYNRMKAEMENHIIDLEFPCTYIYRPSLLLGKRKEKRTAESAGIFFNNLFSWVIPAKYSGIKAQTVAQCMFLDSLSDEEGAYIIESGCIKKRAQNF